MHCDDCAVKQRAANHSVLEVNASDWSEQINWGWKGNDLGAAD